MPGSLEQTDRNATRWVSVEASFRIKLDPTCHDLRGPGIDLLSIDFLFPVSGHFHIPFLLQKQELQDPSNETLSKKAHATARRFGFYFVEFWETSMKASEQPAENL